MGSPGPARRFAATITQNDSAAVIAEKDAEISRLRLALHTSASHAARTSARLALVLASLEAAHAAHTAERATVERLRDTLARYQDVVRVAEIERDECRDAVIALAERIELSKGDFTAWSHSRITIPQLLDPIPDDAPSRTEAGAEDKEELWAYAAGTICALRGALAAERAAHAATRRAARAQLVLLEAQLARREADAEARCELCVRNLQFSATTAGPLDIDIPLNIDALPPDMDIPDAPTFLARTATQTAALEAEVARLVARLERARLAGAERAERGAAGGSGTPAPAPPLAHSRHHRRESSPSPSPPRASSPSDLPPPTQKKRRARAGGAAITGAATSERGQGEGSARTGERGRGTAERERGAGVGATTRTVVGAAPDERDPSQRIPPRPRRAAPKVPPTASRKARPAYGDPDPDPDPDRTVRPTDRRRAPVDDAGNVDLRRLADGPHASLAREIAALSAQIAALEVNDQVAALEVDDRSAALVRPLHAPRHDGLHTATHASLEREIAALGAQVGALAAERAALLVQVRGAGAATVGEAATAGASGAAGAPVRGEAVPAAASGKAEAPVVRVRDSVGLRPRDADRGTSAVVPEVHPAHLARAQQGPPPSEAHLLHAPNPPRSRQGPSAPTHRLEAPAHPQEVPTHPPNEGPSLLDDLDGEMSMDLATPLLPAVVVLPVMPHPDALSVAIPHPDAHTYANPAGLSLVIPPSHRTRSPASAENGLSDDDDIDDDTIPTTRTGARGSAVVGTAGAAGDMMISPLDLTASVSLPEAPAAHSTPNRDPDYYSSSLASNLEYADLRYNPEYAALDGNRDFADLDGNHGYADPHYNNDPSDSSNLEYAGLDGEYHAYAGTGEDAVRELMDMVAVVSSPRSLAPRRFSLHRETGDAAAGNAFDAWLLVFFEEARSAWPEEARVTTRRKLLTPTSLRYLFLADTPPTPLRH
ncbi:hypothetical protein C8J57DRAFT_1614407 [Mycena rebaudengoi]|nr:hypothetical protein C8J57DRAFT_1614407 [Mycena rebaudengoi]